MSQTNMIHVEFVLSCFLFEEETVLLLTPRLFFEAFSVRRVTTTNSVNARSQFPCSPSRRRSLPHIARFSSPPKFVRRQCCSHGSQYRHRSLHRLFDIHGRLFPQSARDRDIDLRQCICARSQQSCRSGRLPFHGRSSTAFGSRLRSTSSTSPTLVRRE